MASGPALSAWVWGARVCQCVCEHVSACTQSIGNSCASLHPGLALHGPADSTPRPRASFHTPGRQPPLDLLQPLPITAQLSGSRPDGGATPGLHPSSALPTPFPRMDSRTCLHSTSSSSPLVSFLHLNRILPSGMISTCPNRCIFRMRDLPSVSLHEPPLSQSASSRTLPDSGPRFLPSLRAFQCDAAFSPLSALSQDGQ